MGRYSVHRIGVQGEATAPQGCLTLWKSLEKNQKVAVKDSRVPSLQPTAVGVW